MKKPSIAIIHDWLVNYAGAEKVLEQILHIFPEADLYSTVEFLPEDLKWYIKGKKVHTTFIQKLPFARKKYRSYLPVMPLAIEQLDVTKYDIVISSSYAVAKGIITNVNQIHICYCHSPMRYAWDLYHQYLREAKLTKGIRGFFAKLVLHYMRVWDYTTAGRVDYFIANSEYVAKRIRKVYHKEATVIYPPVDTGAFQLETRKEDFYLVASRMVPYKKIDTIVQAFAQMPDKKLVVVGEGPDLNKIKRHATPNIQLLNYVEADRLKELMQKAKAFVIAADEDFGITAVEAQACGTPVIAFGKGGVRESVAEDWTGVFFDEQTPESIIEAVERFEQNGVSATPAEIRANSLRFGINVFRQKFRSFVTGCMEEETVSSKAKGHLFVLGKDASM
ncbi:MAG TPA: glycosyltransferase family 4 protein [Puia sp.]|nr:glycosyltransferase family 4 protein [Puia sp.]